MVHFQIHTLRSGGLPSTVWRRHLVLKKNAHGSVSIRQTQVYSDFLTYNYANDVDGKYFYQNGLPNQIWWIHSSESLWKIP